MKNPSFKFQLMWLCDPSIQNVMFTWWSKGRLGHGRAMYSFFKIPQDVKYYLKQWNKYYFCNIHSHKMNSQARLDAITFQIWEHGLSLDLQREEAYAVKDLEEWDLREEILQRQNS